MESEPPSFYTLNDSIWDLDLSRRAKNSLTDLGILKISEFLTFDTKEIYKLRNAGRKTIQEIDQLQLQLKRVFRISEISTNNILNSIFEEFLSIRADLDIIKMALDIKDVSKNRTTPEESTQL